MRARRDFAGDHGQARGDERLASHAPFRVLLHDFVENGIGNLVGNLVRVTFGDRLRRK